MSRSISKLRTVSLVAALALSFGAFANDISRGGNKGPDANEPFPSIQIDKMIIMPMATSHSDWVSAIKNARTSIHMEMYHVTEKPVIDALISRAHDNIDMRVIIDHKVTGGYKAAMDTLTSAGVQVRPASPFFSITHSKTMIVDGKTAWVTSINMTNTGTSSRDFGILTPDKGIIEEIDKVFESDWANFEATTDTTPAVSNPNLAWSPTNSTNQLVKLINSATKSLVVEVENLGANDLTNAFNAAATRGVDVRVIIPQCGGNEKNNYAALAQLKGIKYHVEPDGKSLDQPYLHAKMIVADGKRNYIGSINFSYNSTQKSRELGVIFLDENIGGQLSNEFQTDWNRSIVPGATPDCGKSTGGGGSGNSNL